MACTDDHDITSAIGGVFDVLRIISEHVFINVTWYLQLVKHRHRVRTCARM